MSEEKNQVPDAAPKSFWQRALGTVKNVINTIGSLVNNAVSKVSNFFSGSNQQSQSSVQPDDQKNANDSTNNSTLSTGSPSIPPPKPSGDTTKREDEKNTSDSTLTTSAPHQKAPPTQNVSIQSLGTPDKFQEKIDELKDRVEKNPVSAGEITKKCEELGKQIEKDCVEGDITEKQREELKQQVNDIQQRAIKKMENQENSNPQTAHGSSVIKSGTNAPNTNTVEDKDTSAPDRIINATTASTAPPPGEDEKHFGHNN